MPILDGVKNSPGTKIFFRLREVSTLEAVRFSKVPVYCKDKMPARNWTYKIKYVSYDNHQAITCDEAETAKLIKLWRAFSAKIF